MAAEIFSAFPSTSEASGTPAAVSANPVGGEGSSDELNSAAANKAVALEEPIDPEKYLCGPGDQFQLNFWGQQNTSLQLVIDAQGRAFIPKVGYVTLADLTLAAATSSLKGAVAKYYPRLKFDLSLVKPRTFLVHVVGAVARPGIYGANATDRLTKVLDRAGGRRGEDASGYGAGSTRQVEINRRGGQRLKADLLLYNRDGDRNNNPYLSDGDVIVVPFEALTATISGAVQRPGRYELVSTKDLSELVAVAGGLTSGLTSQLPVVVSRRDSNENRSQLRFPLLPNKGLPPLELKDNDSIHIPTMGELQRVVILSGAVAGAAQADEATTLRRMPYEEGDTVRSLLERAGGVSTSADYKNSYIARMDGDKRTIIPVDLEALLVYRNMKADKPVQMGDVITVPFLRRAITIEGAVVHPGAYPFNPQLRALDYITIAGGPGKMAQDDDEFRIVTPQGKTHGIDKNTLVQPGDTIVLPERHFSRSEVVTIIISAVSLAIATGTLAVVATK